MGLLTRAKPIVGSVTVPSGPGVEVGRVQTQDWQRKAWDYWGRLGELMYPTTHLARLVSRLDWAVEVNGRLIDDPAEVLEQATEGPGLGEATELIALNIQVAGEVWYVLGAGDDAEWDVMSVIDPKLREAQEDKDRIRIRSRVPWPPDKMFATSMFRAALGPAEELLTLEALSRAQSRSRISQAGMILRPTGMQFPDGDPFGRDLQEAMTAPITDEHHPSALVPIDIEMPADLIEKVRHLVLERPYDEKLHDRMERVIRRIALALDIPAELLLGLGEINHWSAWLIKEDTWQSHGDPLASRVGDVLSVAAEQRLPEGTTVKVTPDPAEILARRSTVRDAFDAASVGAVGLRYLRDAIGADDEDAPTDEDLEILAMMRGRARTPGADEAPGAPSDEGTPVTAAVEADAEMEQLSQRLVALDTSLRDRLGGAMALAVDQARNRVGAKVRTALRNAGGNGEHADIPNADLVAALGARAYELVDVEATVRESFGNLARWWDATLRDARGALGRIGDFDTSGVRWDEAQARSVEGLVDDLTVWTVEQLDRSESEQHQIPAGLARKAVAVAGGSQPG